MSVQSKVRLEDIVGVKRDIKAPKLRWHLRARVKSRHVDFLIIDDQGRPRIAIELDGDVHQTQQTNNADALKDGIFKACGIPLIRVRTGEDFHLRVKDVVMNL